MRLCMPWRTIAQGCIGMIGVPPAWWFFLRGRSHIALRGSEFNRCMDLFCLVILVQ